MPKTFMQYYRTIYAKIGDGKRLSEFSKSEQKFIDTLCKKNMVNLTPIKNDWLVTHKYRSNGESEGY
ncbi:MAG: hypothetical protein ACREHG_10150 [Candidatus Saccharimonadales bacterium]